MARTAAGSLPTDEELDLGPEDEEAEIDNGDALDEGEGDAGDEAGEGDDAGQDDAGDEEEGDEPRDVAPRRRAGDTIRTLRQRSQNAERELADLKRQVDGLSQQRPPAYDPAAAARAEAEEIERISMLPPAEQTAAILAKVRRETQQQVAQTELRNFDRSDIANFNRLRGENRTAERLAGEVETILGRRRAGGDYTLGREEIFHFLLGREVSNRVKTQAPRQRAAARRRVQGQTTRPGAARGDVGRTGRNGLDEDARREQRLRNVTIQDIF